MGLKTKVFLLIPLSAFAAIVFGVALYVGLCKSSAIPLNC